MKNTLWIAVVILVSIFGSISSSMSEIALCPTDASQSFDNCRGRRAVSERLIYDGVWKANKPNGPGRMLGLDWEYSGNFFNGQRHGFGVAILANKSRYVGQWARDQMDGAGIYYSADGKLLQSGTWISDQFKDSHKVNVPLFKAIYDCETSDESALKRIESCTEVLRNITAPEVSKLKVRLKGREESFRNVAYGILAYRAYAYGALGENLREIEDLKTRQSIQRTESDYVKLGASYIRLGKCEDAIQNLKTAVASNPNHRYVKEFGYFHLAITKVLCKDSSSAIPELERATLENPKSLYPVIWLVATYGDNGIVDAISSRPNDPWQRFLLDQIATFMKEPSTEPNLNFVHREFIGSSSIQRSCEANFYIGYALFARGNNDRARRYINAAESYCPLNYFESAPLKFIATILHEKSPKVDPDVQPTQKVNASTGSGFQVAENYYVTNSHVVEGCREFEVGDKNRATLVYADKDQDLALLKTEKSFGSVARIRTDPPKLSEKIIVAGYPLQSMFEGISITSGAVNRLTGFRGDRTHFQITAPIQPGNSGGPVLDGAGNVIGVVVATLRNKPSDVTPQNVNFAISISELVSFLGKKEIQYRKGSLSRDLAETDVAERATTFTQPIKCR
jgi:S1-C subfamily serine protease